jgi:hypothetical protein
VPDPQFAEVLRVRVAPERPTPARFGVDVGPWDAVLARAMAVAPGERFDDAGALAAALRATVASADAAATAAIVATVAPRLPAPRASPAVSVPGLPAAATTSAPAPFVAPGAPAAVSTTMPSSPSSPSSRALRTGLIAAGAVGLVAAVVAWGLRLGGSGQPSGVRGRRDGAPTSPPTGTVNTSPVVSGGGALRSPPNAPAGAGGPLQGCTIELAEPVPVWLGVITYGMGGLRVASNDPRATAQVDGVPVALNTDVWRPRGTHQLTVARPGCPTATTVLPLMGRRIALVRVDIRGAPR